MKANAMEWQYTRRDFCRLMTGSAAALTYAVLTGGCECLLKEIENRPIRRCIRPDNAEVTRDLEVYSAAVAAMRALPSNDPRNWTKQAGIHFDHCRHGSWFFFPWHRAYLSYFEAICRKLTGASDWA